MGAETFYAAAESAGGCRSQDEDGVEIGGGSEAWIETEEVQ